MAGIRWKDEPEVDDYSETAEYLSLLVGESIVERVIERLQDAPVIKRRTRDVVAAAGVGSVVPLPHDVHLPEDDEELSPVLLLVAGELAAPLIVAGGLETLCAAQLAGEAEIPCKLIHLP
jgi:hypothetical protein